MKGTVVVALAAAVACSAGATYGDDPCRPSDLPLNITWQKLDANHLPLNPSWVSQCLSNPVALPDPEVLCKGFPPKAEGGGSGIPFGSPPCTNQTTADMPRGLHKFICGLEGFIDHRSNVARGHINWWPATYTGRVWFMSRSGADHDLNFELVPDAKAPNGAAPGLTKFNTGRVSALSVHVEMKDEESLQHVGPATGFWIDLKNAVNKQAGAPDPKTLVSGVRGSVTGLFGLDAEHQGHSELHPIYAMSLLTTCDEQPEGGWYDDVWALFLRNNGNEGWCSAWKDRHFFDPTANTFVFDLPLGTEVREARIGAVKMAANIDGVTGPSLITTAAGPAVAVRWPALASAGSPLRVHGTVAVRWKPKRSFARKCTDPSSALVAAMPQPPRGPEAFVEELLAKSGSGGAGTVAAVAPPDAKALVAGAVAAPAHPGTGRCPGGAASCTNLKAPIGDRMVKKSDLGIGAFAIGTDEEVTPDPQELAEVCAGALAVYNAQKESLQAPEAAPRLARLHALLTYCEVQQEE